ncbi:BTAD domain-containing putative transcriptional regulator [Kineosporia sp. A_224]|uniref:BTAD domain-containing putative transcriptional regulator n=1 Tax=Kineosporia sp. A_224 TaxID=1962180 RepID=UPI000B4BA803|nr:BTAD domain-containing putative transcriptional regulator [Kineosporia sp. A_224]
MAAGARSTSGGARGVVVLVAAPGYGRTTALERFAEEPAGPGAAPALLVGARALLAAGLVDAGIGRLLVDDLDDLDAPDRAALAGLLADLPADVRVVLATTRPLDAAVRTALRRPVLVRCAADLALTAEGTARVLREEHGVTDLDVADAVHAATAGWPVLVHLAADVAATPGADAAFVRARLAAADSPCRHWLADRVLTGLDAPALDVLDRAVRVGPVAPALLREVLGDETADAVRRLTVTGLLGPADLPLPGPARAHDDTDHVPVAVVPALAAAVRAERPSPPRAEVVTAAGSAARWFAAGGRPLLAARLLRAADEPVEAARLVVDHGDAILAGGGAAAVVEIAGDLLDAGGTSASDLDARRLRLVVGDARRMAGDARGALRTLLPLADAADRAGHWPPDLAWRVAMVHYMAGDPREAVEVCRQVGDGVRLGEDGDDVDAVLLATAEMSALFALGDVEGIGRLVTGAVARAERSGRPRALAAAHLVAAGAAEGDAREEHLRLAGESAAADGDVVTLARVLVNRTFTLLGRARFAEAGELGSAAVRAAEAGAPPGLLIAARANLAEALRRVGRFDEAVFHAERALLACRRAGVARASSAILVLGWVARVLGRPEQARMAFEEAVDLARERAQTRELTSALTSLAWLLLDTTPDGSRAEVEAAQALVEEADRISPADLRAEIEVVRGWLGLARGDLDAGAAAAARALVLARDRRSLVDLAHALELAAAAGRDAAAARAALGEAHTVWTRAGATPAADRVLVLLGRLPGASGSDRAGARDAATRLALLGVRVAGTGPLMGEDLTAPLQVQVLGGFEVRAAGRPVPFAAWRSRQARTLVKVLVARRGRPVPRGEICELLWPDDDPQRTAHRLSVLLSVVRGVLDPAKAWPPDRYVRADTLGLSLDLSYVVVDAEELLRDAAHAEEVLADGDDERARDLLAEVDALYRGDAFDDEPYEAWADGLREEVRAAWLRSLRRHATLCRRAGEVDAAVADLVRLLAADAYDESAHHALVRTLVAAGRHGEARRAFDRWTHAMEHIDAPTPSSDVLAARPRAPRPAVVRLPDDPDRSRSVL